MNDQVTEEIKEEKEPRVRLNENAAGWLTYELLIDLKEVRKDCVGYMYECLKHILEEIRCKRPAYVGETDTTYFANCLNDVFLRLESRMWAGMQAASDKQEERLEKEKYNLHQMDNWREELEKKMRMNATPPQAIEADNE